MKGGAIFMASISEFFYKPCILSCPNCNSYILVADLSKYMGISGIEGCELTVYKYDFVSDVVVECPGCHKKFKVTGSVYDGPEEGYVSQYLKLKPLDE